MSSSTPVDLQAGNRMAKALSPGQEGAPAGPPGLSPRQQELDRLWRYYCSEEYADRRVNWDGSPRLSPIDAQAMVAATFVPPGHYDTGANTPLQYRAPSAPCGLIRTIVLRFTGLVCARHRAPRITCPGDPDTEAMLAALARQGRLHATLTKGRNYGGGMGSVAFSFKFLDGRIVFEAHDPRWVEPTHADVERTELVALTKQYAYPLWERDPASEVGAYIEVWYWYRRVIDERRDVVWEKVRCDGEEPDWDRIAPTTEVVHGLGECPAVWVQNQPVDDAIDGEPDCSPAVYELSHAIDALLSAAKEGTIKNADPTVNVNTDAEFAELAKGSDNAIKLEKGGSAHYMELAGTGAKTCMELSEKLEEKAYRAAQCVPESVMQGSLQPKTATEIERAMSPMTEKADVLRDQYGDHGVLPLMEKVERVVRKLAEGTRDAQTGQRRVAAFRLPPKPVHGPDGAVTGYTTHKLGPGGHLELAWGPYFPPSLADTELAGRAATGVLRDGTLDPETVVRFVAPYFGQRDPVAVLARLAAKKQADAAEAAAQQAAAAPPPPEPEPPPVEEPAEPEPPPPFGAKDLELGIVTVNEYRERLGLGALPDGDLTYVQWKAKNADLLTVATAVTSAAAGPALFGAANAGKTLAAQQAAPAPTNGAANGATGAPPPGRLQ